jgi:hypothetical protein
MSDKQPEKWIGFRQEPDGAAIAVFAMPSGRTREIPVTRIQMLNAMQELARALKYTEPKP